MVKQNVLIWCLDDGFLFSGKGGLLYGMLVDYAIGNNLFTFYNKKSLTRREM